MNFKETTFEILCAILPITAIIILCHFTIIKFPREIFISFIAGSIMVIVGILIFIIGVNGGLLKVGEFIGNLLASKGNVWALMLFMFIIGFVVTIAEPDVQVLASQIDSVSNGNIPYKLLVIVVSLGVAIFLIMALIRILFNIPLINILFVSYLIIFILSYFTSPQFIPLAFDAGGVTTGSVTVPFILSLGVGITAITARKNSTGDTFGFVALASTGPILAVLILGVIFK